MKTKSQIRKLVVLSLAVFLIGCNNAPETTSPSSGQTQTNTTAITGTSNPTSTSGTSSTSTPPSGKEVTLNIFATNDIHGQINSENPEYNDGRVGIGKTMTFLKEKKDHGENVLLLDQGDTWQGSIYSNINHGEMITDIMNYVHYDARTIGNHDFDWGPEFVKKNAAKSYNGYITPSLGANIYDYDFDTKTAGNTQQSELGKTSVTYTIDGLKVGIVGTIGYKQITTINSIYMHDLCFKEHISIIKEEATKLRNEGCQVVIASTHGGQEDVRGYNLGNYVDLVLCSHTHKFEKSNEGDLYFVQFGSYSKAVGHINLTYNFDTQKVATNISSFSATQIDSEVKEIDPTIQSIIDSYYQDAIDAGANDIIANNVSGYFGSYSAGANLLAKAIYDEAFNEGYNVDFSYVNNLRHDLSGPTLTYADLYEAAPFDNNVYIIDVSLKEIKDEILSYNYLCKPSGTMYLEDRTYKVACLDYLAFHTDEYRYYNYFPSIASKDINTIPHLTKNYRTILKDYLIDNDYDKGKLLAESDYYSNNSIFNKGELVFPVVEVVLNYNYDDIKSSIFVNYAVYLGSVAPSLSRTDYSFDGWCYDKEGNNKINYYDPVVTKIEIFAKWKEIDAGKFETGDVTYQYFGVGNTTHYVNAIDGNSNEITLTIESSPIIIKENYREFGIEAYGFFHLLPTTGYKITHFEIAQWKYSNLALYDASSDDPSYQLSVDINAATYDGSPVQIYTFDGEANEIYVKNTYQGSIDFKYLKVSLEKN